MRKFGASLKHVYVNEGTGGRGGVDGCAKQALEFNSPLRPIICATTFLSHLLISYNLPFSRQTVWSHTPKHSHANTHAHTHAHTRIHTSMRTSWTVKPCQLFLLMKLSCRLLAQPAGCKPWKAQTCQSQAQLKHASMKDLARKSPLLFTLHASPSIQVCVCA